MAEEKHDEMFKDFFKKDKDDDEEKRKDKKGRKSSSEDIQISLVLRKRDIERAAYIAVILFLIILYFFFPYSGNGLGWFGGGNETVAKVTEAADTDKAAETAKDSPKENTTAAPKPAPVVQKPLEKSSKSLELKIEQVYSEKKSWGGIITKVVYTISNTAEIIDDAVLKIYVYDDNSEAQWKAKERERVEFPSIGLNPFTRTTSIAGAGVSFTDLTKPKTVKLDLIDADGKLVVTATSLVNI